VIPVWLEVEGQNALRKAARNYMHAGQKRLSKWVADI
jgi:hypothetical protein